ncbi:MAG: flagellar hook-basal body complex protein [Rhodospirillales bacterium]|nr:flagellar hook-basal body complex protein [Rhodospirillales bacterium]
MSLFGAMFSGVSGLTAQSSAMGAVSDNITNVSTIGYKNTEVNFQTLVTKQVSATFYSAGGVQSKPRQRTEVQGLLQASTSQTDIAISGQGFFVVNEAAKPTNSDQFLYTRAGSFIMDNEGYLKNTSGYYLQGWPTDAAGVVQAVDPIRNPIPNQNIVSTDFLQTINLSRVGGTAAATTTIAIGANLPANASTYDPVLATAQTGFQKTDVQFFDTLGNAGTFSVSYMRSGRANQWDVDIVPPSGTTVMTLYDSTPLTPLVYDSKGLLEFTARPSEGATITIDGTTYEFDTDGSVTGTNTAVNIATATTLSDDVARLLTAIQTTDTDFAAAYERVTLSPNSPTALLFHENGTDAISVNPVGLLDANGNPVTKQTSAFNVLKQNAAYSDNTQITFGANPVDGNTIVINGITYEFESVGGVGAGNTAVTIGAGIGATLANLEAAIEVTDAQMSGNRVRIRDNGNTGVVDTLVLSSLPSGSYAVTGTGLTVTEPDGTALDLVTGTTVNTLYGLHFDVDGLPKSVNVGSIEILGFASGAADMNGALGNSPRIAMDFGTLGEADGMTQFGASFTPVFIQQNGSRFGTFAGVTISPEGLVTALFDNGETRNIFKIPIATFVNPNSLEARTGNIWNATEASGDYTLRVADSGPAGAVTQGALEASTVDIGEEFTKMIVVQRAYSASTKIIRTADEMLDELTRIK